jgi:hypothetical protein
MAAFLSNQLDFIFFFYGLAFILLLVSPASPLQKIETEENPGLCSGGLQLPTARASGWI